MTNSIYTENGSSYKLDDLYDNCFAPLAVEFQCVHERSFLCALSSRGSSKTSADLASINLGRFNQRRRLISGEDGDVLGVRSIGEDNAPNGGSLKAPIRPPNQGRSASKYYEEYRKKEKKIPSHTVTDSEIV
ncbi:hypothetical protein CEXT_27911 [Caerostris extrusa]|uniref:Uncharacterized protein n=1 Tax=Caerostris extrusa TaxID=172846 RepID=A0AAV4XLR9_CAEEX|nr:hypothetical protein CEXT_27911 [Caerostris extrusa]